jgi:hypothetical protein
MASDVVGTLDANVNEIVEESDLLGVFLGRVRGWQEFMRKGSQALSPEAEIGLIGELSILAALVISGLSPHVSVEAWLGPLGGVQDFEIGMGALEVKSTISSAGFPAHIGSLDQLNDSKRQPLFIVGARFKQNVIGKNLPDFVDSVRSLISDDHHTKRVFSDRLISAGYFDAHFERYPRRFVLSSFRVLEVVEDFPRITQSTIHPVITRVTYSIDLDQIKAETVELVTMLKKLGAI